MKFLFEEKQRFSQWWVWLIAISSALLVIGLFVIGIYEQLVLGDPWGDIPMSDEMLVTVSLFSISAVVGMLLLFFTSVLETVVDRDSVSYRYFPLIRSWRRIEKEAISRYEVQNELQMRYGVHRDLSGNWTINVSGRSGILLTLYDGRTLLLGTQLPVELLNALKKMKSGRTD